MAFAVEQNGQAAGTEARKGGARPARVGGPFMTFIYRVLLTFCYHVRAASRNVLVRQLGMWKRMWHVDSDILCMNLVACVRRMPRGLFAFARAAG